MKKILLTATLLVGLSAMSNAQDKGVGINTTTPKASLDVATTSDNTMPDAVLVPRFSLTQLQAKNGAYAADQNGALVFVNDITGTPGGKTVNITATGFYYYDSVAGEWKTLGGGGTDTSLYLNNGTLGGDRVVTQANHSLTFTTGTNRLIVNGTQQNTGAQFIKYRKVTAPPITWADDDHALVLEFGANFSGSLTLPDAAANPGRIIYIGNSTGATASFGASNTSTTPRVGTSITTGTGFTYVSDGTTWYILSGR